MAPLDGRAGSRVGDDDLGAHVDYEPESRGFGVADVRKLLRRHWFIIGTCLVLSTTAAGIYVNSTDPIYSARAQIVTEPRTPQVFGVVTGEPSLSLDTAQVESNIVILQSEQIAMAVVSKLNLTDDAEFGLPRKTWMSALKARLGLTPRPSTEPASIEVEKLRRSVAAFLNALDVRRVGLSYAIDIYFKSHDPEKAARIANATAQAYVDDQLTVRADAARQGSDWLQVRIDQLSIQMNQAALAVQEFKAKRDYRLVDQTSFAQEQRRLATPDRDAKSGSPEVKAGAAADYSVMLPRNHAVTLEELESRAQTYRKIYESYLQAFAESVQRQSYPVSNTRIITLATRPWVKSEPRTELIMALSLLVGLLAGIGSALTRDQLRASKKN